LATDYRHHFLI